MDFTPKKNQRDKNVNRSQRHKPGGEGNRRPNQEKTVVRQEPIKKRGKGKEGNLEYDYDYERSVKFANRGCFFSFLTLAAAVVIVLTYGFFYVTGEMAGRHANFEGPKTVEVLPNSGGQRIAAMLKENGLIGNEAVFRFYARINGITGFKAGEFDLQAGMSYDEIVEVLTQPAPERETMRVSFPEGWSIERFAQRVEEVGLCTAEEFLNEANNGEFPDIPFLQEIDFRPNTYMRAEGYLFPSTYDFYVDSTPYEVVDRLFRQMQTQIDGGINTSAGVVDIRERMAELGINLREMITLASLIEKEASGAGQDMATVSGVFWNRLHGDNPEIPRRTMGADATTRYIADFIAQNYGVHDYTDWTLADMKIDMLTYIPHDLFYAYYTGDEDENSIEGLPAGPLGCPGMMAITAALFPETHDYYYYVTDDYGEFRYASTYSQHLSNVDAAAAANALFEAEQQAQGDE